MFRKNIFEKVNICEGYNEVTKAYTWNDKSCGIIVLDDEASNRMPNQMTESLHENELIVRYEGLLSAMSWHFMLVVADRGEQIQIVFYSDSRRVRALEFLDYLISEFGLIKGDAGCACGWVSSLILKAQISGLDMENATEYIDYFLEQTKSYFVDTVIVETADYAEREKNVIEQMPMYRKKDIPWAYVRTLDVAKPGQKLKIRSLENESGTIITAAEDVYIMIGCRGEVYDITRERFNATYVPSDKPLDIFEQLLDFLPAMELAETGEYVSLDEAARLCFPDNKPKIRAILLSHRTKVYPVNGNGEYYLGRAGDYMAVRIDDYSDVYIIQQDIFEQTYEEV